MENLKNKNIHKAYMARRVVWCEKDSAASVYACMHAYDAIRIKIKIKMQIEFERSVVWRTCRECTHALDGMAPCHAFTDTRPECI